MQPIARPVVLLLLAGSALAGSGAAQVPSLLAEVQDIADNPASGEYFGWSMDMDEGVLVVGEPYDNGAGLVHVYRFDGLRFLPEQTLAPADLAANDDFGWDVAIAGDVIFASSPRDDDNGVQSGSVYVFGFDGTRWNEVGKLTPSGAAIGDYFGFSVATDGVRVVAGVPLDAALGTGVGAAVVFVGTGSGWVEEQYLRPRGPVAGQFGFDVGIDGDLVVVGAPQSGQQEGAVYLFRQAGGGWTREATFPGAAGDQFGWSVAVDDDVVAASLPLAAVGGVVVYREDPTSSPPWRVETQINPWYRDYGLFGQSLALSGDWLTIGAPVASWYPYTQEGVAEMYRFDGSRWSQYQRLTGSDATLKDRFGWSLATDGQFVAACSLLDDPFGSNEGSVFVFEYRVDPCRNPAPSQFLAKAVGVAIAISGDLAVTTDPGDPAGGNLRGSAGLYRLVAGAWTREATITASDGADKDLFGNAVACESGLVLVGAQARNSNRGAAYLYQQSGGGWQEVAEFEDPAGNPNDFFGCAVAIEPGGTRLAIGAYQKGYGSGPSGRIFIEEWNGSGWSNTAVLACSGSGFGKYLALAGGWLVGGAWDGAHVFGWNGSAYVETQLLPGYRLRGGIALDQGLLVYTDTDAGLAGEVTAFRFDGSQWVLDQVVTPSDGRAGEEFGYSVDLSGGLLVVLSASHLHRRANAVYVYRRVNSAWQEERELLGSATATYSQATAVAVDDGRVLWGFTGASYKDVECYDLDLSLDLGAERVRAGQPLVFHVCDALPASPVVVIVVDVGGVPVFVPVARGWVGTDHQWQGTVTVPPGLGGLGVTAQAIGLNSSGVLRLSNLDSVELR